MVKDMPENFDSIIEILQNAFKQLPEKCECIVLAIGNSGSGKSTMINAYIDGKEFLH